VKGSVDWEAVRKADLQTVFESIRCGGLANIKANIIKDLLDDVYQMNCAHLKKLQREKAIVAEDLSNSDYEQDIIIIGAKIAKLEENFLSMDYLYELDTEAAMNEMMKLPGIGVKTSACVTLFCMKRPCFAVDTHVTRFCKWLDWVPANATANKVFMHLEVHIPDNLKYSLHQLFLKHGRTCIRCKGNAPMKSEAWEKAVCPLEKFLDRNRTAQNGKVPETFPEAKAKFTVAKKRKRNVDSDEADDGYDG